MHKLCKVSSAVACSSANRMPPPCSRAWRPAWRSVFLPTLHDANCFFFCSGAVGVVPQSPLSNRNPNGCTCTIRTLRHTASLGTCVALVEILASATLLADTGLKDVTLPTNFAMVSPHPRSLGRSVQHHQPSEKRDSSIMYSSSIPHLCPMIKHSGSRPSARGRKPRCWSFANTVGGLFLGSALL